MRPILVALLMGLAGPCFAESHDWERLRPLIDVPSSTASLLANDELVLIETFAVQDRVVTIWKRPAYVDETQTDFLGNPLQVVAQIIRCYEDMTPQGYLELDFCELGY